MKKQFILESNQQVFKWNGYWILLTFKTGKRVLTNPEENEIKEQINYGVYAGAITDKTSWKAMVAKNN